MPAKKGRARDAAHLAFVRTLPCVLSRVFAGCEGRTHAHHVPSGGMGTKSDDTRTYPLCSKHHNERHAMSGWWRKTQPDFLKLVEENFVVLTLKQKAEGEIT